MLSLRILIFYFMLIYSHNQIQSVALPINMRTQHYNNVVNNNTATTLTKISPTTQPTTTPVNYTALAMLPQLNLNNRNNSITRTDSSSYLSTNISTSPYQELLEEEKEFKKNNNISTHAKKYVRPHSQKLQNIVVPISQTSKIVGAQLQQELEQRRSAELIAERAARAKILHSERAQVKTEKEILQKFTAVKESAFKKIEGEITQPMQWGDNFPITKTFFAYLGWREEDDLIAERKRLKTEKEATKIACEEIQTLVMAMATSTAHDNKLQKSMQLFIDNGIDCGQFADEKNEINDNALYRRSDNNISTNFIDHSRVARLDDVIDEGRKCKQYVFVDDNGQYDCGYLVSYDGKAFGLFKLSKPITTQPSRTMQQTQQFHTYHEQSTVRMKINCLKNSPIIQRDIVDWHFKQGRITDLQAIQHYQRIEYATNLADARAAVKQFEKTQNPSLIRRSINYFFGKAPEQKPATISPCQPVNNQTAPTPCGQLSEVSTNPASPESVHAVHKSTIIPDTTTQTATHEISTITTPTTPNNSTLPPVNLPPLSQVEQAFLASTIRNALPTTTNSPAHDIDNKKHTVSPEGIKNKPARHYETPETTETQTRRQQLIEAQDAWMKRTDLNNADPKEKAMVNNLLDTIVDAQNDISVEFAQAGLQSWTKAQQAQSGEERAYHIKKSQALHEAMQHKTPTQSIAQQAFPIKEKEIDNLLQDYTAAINMHREEYGIDRKEANAKHFDRLEKRAQALTESKEQIRTSKQMQHTYELSPQARGFMMANNINYASFDGDAKVTNFQHCLTQEILDVVESSAKIAENYDTKSIIGRLATYNCNLAVAAQQLNQLARIDDAVAVVDLSHFFNAYAQVLVDSGLHAQMTMNASLGIGEGTVRALHKWGKFLYELGDQPHQTIGKITNDLQKIGISLHKIAGRAAEFTPAAYLDDATRDMLDSLARIRNRDGSVFGQDQTSRIMQRTQRNAQYLQDGLSGAVQTAQIVVDDMMQKSLRENAADFTEVGVDAFITGKATDCLMKLAEIVGTPILRMGEKLAESIPTNLYDSKPIFMASPTTGELFAIADTTGESIGAAVAAKKFTDDFKKAAQATEIYNQAKNGSGGNGGDSKQKSAPAKNYTYENGKYDGAGYHKKGKTTSLGGQTKSPSPEDGQKCLDNSYRLDKYVDRVAIEDNKYVVLYSSNDGTYHGFVCSEWKDVPKNMQEIFREHKLVHPKSGALKK